ncbi:MAG: DUF6754 domain-containing protein [Armatimonadota bacterium]
MEVSIDHGNVAIYIIEGIIIFAILFNIFRARKGKKLFIRRIPGLSALDEAVGRATEMGRPMLYSPGIRGIDIVGLQSMAILSHVIRQAAKFGSKTIVPVADALLFTVAEEVTKDAYSAEGVPEMFESQDVRFLSERQFSWASGVVGIQHREKVASCFYFGSFFAESLIVAENGQMVGAIQIAGTPSTTQIPFFLATCDYTIIGDEYFAASAYLSREPTLLGSLVGQDYGKFLIVIIMFIGAIIATIAANSSNTELINFLDNYFLKYFPGGIK